MNRDEYEEAWTNLLAARRNGNLKDVRYCARRLQIAAGILEKEKAEEQLNPCSHFMVVNGHCINCHEPIQRASALSQEIE